MKKYLKEIQDSSYNTLNEVIKDTLYEVKRYEKECTIALLYSFDPIDTDAILQMARKSDNVIPLDKNACFILFAYTPIEGGIKALEKFIVLLNSNGTKEFYAAALGCNPNLTGSGVVRKLFNLIDFAIDNNHINEVLDSTYLDSVY